MNNETKLGQSLIEVVSSLNVLPESLEKDFLRVGEKLRTIAFITDDITRNSGQIIELMNDSILRKLTDGLIQVLKSSGADTDGKLPDGVDIYSPLGGMETLLGGAQSRICELQKRVASLRNLALQTRITSRSAGKKEAEFDGVAESIKNLGSMITEKTTAINSGLHRLCTKAREASAMILDSRSRRQHLGKCVAREIRHSLEVLGRTHNNCTSFSQLISDQSTEMTGNIAEVVSSIQYHDITRQKMEHARAALEGILAAEIRNSTAIALSDRDREISDICELQVVQLQHAHLEITHAIQTMDQSLKTIAAASSRIESDADRLSGAASIINDSNLAGVDHGISAAISFYAKDVEAEEELFQIMQSVVETTGEITHFLEGIDWIGEEIKLIALNAMVKALGLQQQGAGLHVIATAIKDESDGICAQTAAISDNFLQTAVMADQLKGLLEKVHGDRVTEQENLSSNLMVTLGEVQHRNQSIIDFVQVIQQSSQELRELITDALNSVFDSGLQSTLAESVIPTLEDIVLELRKNQAFPAGKHGVGFMVGKLRGAYTMNLEREIHDRYMTGNDAPRGKVILFPNKDSTPPAKIFNEENLGQNVDIF
jgi:hypothetical protein